MTENVENNQNHTLPIEQVSDLKKKPNKNDNVDSPVILTNQPEKTPIFLRTLPLIILTIAFIGWAFLAKIPVKVVGQSIVLIPRSKVNFWSRSEGRVLDLKIQPGDLVRKGQVLALLEASELKQELFNKQEELAEYKQENIAITNIERQRSQVKLESLKIQKTTIPLQIQANNQQMESNQQERIAISRQRITYQERLQQIEEIDKLIAARFKAFNDLVAEGVVAPLDPSLIQAEDVLQKNLNEQTELLAKLEDLTAKDQHLLSQNESLQAQNKQLKAQLESLTSQEAEIALDDLESDTKRRNTIDNLQRDIEYTKVQLSTEREVVSEYDGTIMEINVNVGEFVNKGTSIGRLKLESPENSQEIALAFFTPENADRIYPGMSVEVTPNLLTERRFGGSRERYGGIVGKVTTISEETITPNEVTSLVGNPQLAEALMTNPVPYSAPDPGEATNLPVVQVGIELKRNSHNITGYEWVSGKEPPHPIPEGSIGEVRVIVEERSPISYLVPLFRWITGIYYS